MYQNLENLFISVILCESTRHFHIIAGRFAGAYMGDSVGRLGRGGNMHFVMASTRATAAESPSWEINKQKFTFRIVFFFFILDLYSKKKNDTEMVKILLTGPTGTIGGAVLEQCLAHPDISTVVAFARRELPDTVTSDPKLQVEITKDFSVWPEELLHPHRDATAMIWYASVLSYAMPLLFSHDIYLMPWPCQGYGRLCRK
jgi:hypothetical protein